VCQNKNFNSPIADHPDDARSEARDSVDDNIYQEPIKNARVSESHFESPAFIGEPLHCATSEPVAETTLMIRNIARSTTQQEFLDSLNSSGFDGSYDFAYLPFRSQKKRNLGFAFVNFLSNRLAHEFHEKWHRSCKFATQGTKSRYVTVSTAKVQGRDENLRLIKDTSFTTENDYRPVAFVYDEVRELSADFFAKEMRHNFGSW